MCERSAAPAARGQIDPRSTRRFHSADKRFHLSQACWSGRWDYSRVVAAITLPAPQNRADLRSDSSELVVSIRLWLKMRVRRRG